MPEDGIFMRSVVFGGSGKAEFYVQIHDKSTTSTSTNRKCRIRFQVDPSVVVYKDSNDNFSYNAPLENCTLEI